MRKVAYQPCAGSYTAEEPSIVAGAITALSTNMSLGDEQCLFEFAKGKPVPELLPLEVEKKIMRQFHTRL